MAVLLSGIDAGKSTKAIAAELGRTTTSVALKRKRLSKGTGKSYNDPHRDEKYAANLAFLQHLKPRSVLDLYAGPVSYYRGLGYNLTTNDKEYSGHTYNTEAHRVLGLMLYEGRKFCLVDLDPFGSAFECLELAVQVARRGLVVTFGELGHRRWRRADYTARTYRIADPNGLTLENLAAYVDEVAQRYKRRAVIHTAHNWRNIGRVYFVLEDMPKQPPRLNEKKTLKNLRG